MFRRIAPIAAVAVASIAAAPPPPPSLAPYIHDGRFDPGDYGWMRGAFADATPAQKAAWEELRVWRKQCRADQAAAARKALASRGVTAIYSVQGIDGRPCGGVEYVQPHGDQGQSWPVFQATLARARPVAQAIVWSAALAQQVADPDSHDLRADLIARPMTDQVLRSAIPWDKGEVAGAPPLPAAELGIVLGQIWLAISERDHANTAWLKATVAKDGWPTIGKVGKDASHMAWLLVQHADDDPVFQFDMLRLMEPLAARGEVAKKDYAYLYDRVMLKLTGKQRYASQYTCAGGLHTPLPLEDAARVDALRKDMAMETVAQNVARMEKAYGPCPPDVIPPSPTKR